VSTPAGFHLRGWRSLGAFAALLLVLAALVLPRMSDAAVARYEQNAKRDVKTGIMAGMAPRELGPAGADRAVLLVHGFCGGPGNYNDLPEFLARDGWWVRCMLLPGHGTTPHDFEKTTADDLINGVKSELRAMKAKYKTVVLGGHSLGGALVTLAAAEEPVDGLMLFAPYFGLTLDEVSPISVATAAKFLAKFIRWVPRDEAREPVALAANRKFITSYDWISSQGSLGALEVGRRVHAPEVIAAIDCPVLLVHSHGDRVNSLAAADRAVAKMPAVEKRLAYFDKSDHVIFWDYDRLGVAFEVLAFVDRLGAE